MSISGWKSPELDGINNTSYFTRISKIKRSKNKILSLRDGDRVILDPDAMAAHVVSYFANSFGFAGTMQDSNIIDIIYEMVTEDMNSMLTLVSSMEEITSVVFGLRKEGALSPDGFGGVFFQTY